MPFKYEGKLNHEFLSLFLFYFQVLITIVLVNLTNLVNSRLINNYDSEIHLIINGNGEQNILNDDFQYEPSEVIVNGYPNSLCHKTCNLSENINNITLKFSNQINSTEKMFKDLENILKIDLSNFDASQITSMHEMFKGCSSLTSVILSNSNTYNLVDVSYMFYKCINLKK